MLRHGAAGGGHDAADLLWELEQDSTTAVTIYQRSGAAEVEVDARCTEGCGKGGIFREASRVAPQQLHAHRHPGTGAAAVRQFWHGVEQHFFGKQMIGDPAQIPRRTGRYCQAASICRAGYDRQCLPWGRESGACFLGRWRGAEIKGARPLTISLIYSALCAVSAAGFSVLGAAFLAGAFFTAGLRGAAFGLAAAVAFSASGLSEGQSPIG